MSNETNNEKKELMAKKAFVLYPDQWPALSNLSAQKLGLLFEAIFRTLRGEQGVNSRLDGKVKLAYDFMMNQINLDVEKWERRSAANKKYYEKRKQIKTIKTFKKNSVVDKEEDKVEVEDKVEDKVEGTNSSVVSVEKESSLAATKEISDESANFDEAAARLSKVDDEGWQRNFVYVFNELVKDSNIPPIKRLSKLRLEKLRVLLKDFTTKDIATVCQKAASSNFLNYGGTKHKFQATFDWLIEPENFLRVLEGTYR